MNIYLLCYQYLTDTVKMTKIAHAYKGFDPNFCGTFNFQYTVGEKYVHDGEIKLCQSGFHACFNPADVLSYYNCDRYAEVLIEDFIEGDDKVVSKIITILREIPRSEFYDMSSGVKSSFGTTRWYKNCKYHRDCDKPAIEFCTGRNEWWIDGVFQRGDDDAFWIGGVFPRGDKPANEILSINIDGDTFQIVMN